MPPLTKEQVEANLRAIQNGLAVAGLGFTEAQIQNASQDPEKRKIRDIALRVGTFRADSEALAGKYNSIPRFKKKYSRIAGYYMDGSGTEEANRKNIELGVQLSTEEGCRQFARRVAGDLLRMDLSECMFLGTAEEAVRFYAENPRMVELGWVALDLLNDGSEYLEPAVADAIKDRLSVLQNIALLGDYVSLTSTECYTYMPPLKAEEMDRIDTANNNPYNDEAVEEAIGGAQAVDFMEFIKQGMRVNGAIGGNYARLCSVARGLRKEGKLNPLMVAKDETGQRISFFAAFEKIAQGRKVSFEKVSPQAERQIAEISGEAVLPVKAPQKNLNENKNALYRNFSKEAESAQGKGFQRECGLLLQEMNRAKLWYTRGSAEFQNITNWLKAAAVSDKVPNKEESLGIMNKILAECTKYIDNKEGLQLSPKKQKRLDAVKAVKASFASKTSFLENVRQFAEVKHMEAEINAGEMTHAFHVSEKNQKNYHTDELEHQAVIYKNRVEHLLGEDGAAGRLAADSMQAMDTLTSYAGTSAGKHGEPYLVEYVTARRLAVIAMTEIVLAGRRTENGRHAAEDMFDKMAEKEKTWNDMMDKFAKMESIKNLAAKIVSSPESAAEFITGKGYEKLVKAVNKEMIAEYGENAPDESLEKSQPSAHSAPDVPLQKKKPAELSVPGNH